jgi:hypothetical protein
VGVLVVANVSALVYAGALAWLVRVELGSPTLASRTAWLVALSPGAVVLALAFAEGLAGAASVVFFLWLRNDRPWFAAAAGVLAGLARPVGLVLVVPAALDLALRRPPSLRRAMSRVVALVSPIVGTAVYLSWVGNQFGDAFLPYSVSRNYYLHGPGFSNPLRTIPSIPYGAARFDARFDVVLVIVAMLLCVVSLRILPLPYTAWAAATVGLSITSATAISLPRYLFSAFPLLLAAVVVARSEPRWTVLISLSAAAFAVVAMLGFTPIYAL